MTRILLLAAALMLSARAGAQDAERDLPAPELKLDDFRLAGPPALSLLGLSAASVSRPNTPRALIASLVSAAGSSGLVPNGYALETAPFWLARHAALQLTDYYNASLSERLLYFTAISAAASRPSSRSDSVMPDARVSIAMRTLLANGRPSAALLAVSDSMRAAQVTYIARYRRWESVRPAAATLAAQRRRLSRQEDLLSTLITKVLVGPERELRDSTLRTLARRDSARAAVAAAEAAGEELERLEGQMDAIEDRLGRLGESYAERDLEPDGLVLEVAAGTRAVFAEGEWNREKVDGIGAWITPMYRRSSAGLEIIGVVRYLTRVAEYHDDDLLDIGGRAGLEVGRATISGEWVRRSVRGAEGRSSSRWAALFDYPLPARLHLVASFGSDFLRADGKRPVVATIGVNLGIGAVSISAQPAPERF